MSKVKSIRSEAVNLTMEEVAGWLRAEGDRVYDLWVDLIGHDRAMRKAKFWRDRAAQVEAMGWRPIDSQHAPHGIPVLLWAEEWIDDDFNPTGVRVGHFIEGEGYTSCGWNACQDVFTTEDESSPTLWAPMPQPPVKK